MLKPGQKNNYQEFLRKKKKYSKKVERGKVFKDTDGDGLSDYEEKKIYGTDPKNSDTDGDGMKDGAEVKRGRNPLGSGMLKDLFIPHAGNNYSPDALKPKRLLFHAASLVAMKAVVVAFILFYPISAWLSPDLALLEAKKIIELTNNLRQAVSLPALLENQRLAQAAWQKVSDMALNQYFAHVSPSGLGLRNWLEKIGYQYAVAGENLAVGFSKAEEVVQAWKESPTHYKNMIDGDFKEIGVAMADGRFSEVDTAFIAQYFGAQVRAAEPAKATAKKPLATPPIAKAPPAKGQLAKETGVKGLNIAEATASPAAPAPQDAGPGAVAAPLAVASSTAPAIAPKENEITIDQASTILSIKSDPFNEEKAIQIKITLPNDTVSAEVTVSNHKIILEAVHGEINNWRGAALISQAEEKDILNPLIPASVAVKNSAGETAYGKIDWDEVKIVKVAPLEHYELFKANPAAAMAPVMALSNFYFKLILIIAIIAILLNIFVEIKKQHPRVIFYSFAFLGLLSAMIIF